MEIFKLVLFLCAALTSAACTALLFRGYARNGARLLLWSALCFIFLTLNNVLLFIDTIVLPTQIDLRIYRNTTSLVAVACLLYAFIWEAE